MLRIIRLTSVILICILAGFYASTLIWSNRAEPDAAREQPIEYIDSLPEFSLEDLNGELRSISEWSGRPLVVNFWATWCAPCRREMPLLQALHSERRNDDLAVIGIAIDRYDAVAAYIAESGISYPILSGEQDAMEVGERFGSGFLALPFTVFTAPGGEILLVHAGEIDADELREIITVSDRVARGEATVDEARAMLAAAGD